MVSICRDRYQTLQVMSKDSFLFPKENYTRTIKACEVLHLSREPDRSWLRSAGYNFLRISYFLKREVKGKKFWKQFRRKRLKQKHERKSFKAETITNSCLINKPYGCVTSFDLYKNRPRWACLASTIFQMRQLKSEK